MQNSFNGGEPLLHPEILDFVECTRNAFPKANISIVTNGILLLRQADKFWSTCSNAKIIVQVSSYLNSGRPVVLTDCYVHNQLVDSSIAILTKPDPVSLAAGLVKGLSDCDYACKIVTKAKEFLNVNFSHDTILDGYKQLFQHIESFTNP